MLKGEDQIGDCAVRLPFSDSPEFQRLLRNEPGSDLIRIALEIARDAYPDLDPIRYLRRIETLVERIRDRCAPPGRARQVLSQINWVLFVEEGFQGNAGDYYDPRNSYLNEVIDRKTGIPISLSVLYWTLGARLGLAMGGVNLPAHFMLRVEHGDAPIFVDPFHSGALLDRRGCERRVAEILGRPVALTDEQVAPCGHEQVVARMLRNLKAIYLRGHEFTAALPVQRRLAALHAADPQEQRDLRMLCLQLDHPADAIAPLQAFLDTGPPPDDAEAVRALLHAARREVALWN